MFHVPHHVAQEGEAVRRQREEPLVSGKEARRPRRGPHVTSLRHDHLVLRLQRAPLVIEPAEEAAVLPVDGPRIPGVQQIAERGAHLGREGAAIARLLGAGRTAKGTAQEDREKDEKPRRANLHQLGW